ncbi:MAG: ferritin-like domain-containing protein, partial [Cyanobacteria bacterium P01_F01_bin.3]
VRVGPQRVVEAIAQAKGGLSRAQRNRLLGELDTETQSGMRLDLLRSLITPAAPDIAETLENKDLFTPLPPAQCV